MEFVSKVKRTHYCGELRAEHAGSEVVLMGWVETRRDHGGLIFLDIRDREGLIQVVVNPADENMATAKDVRNEFVVAFTGEVKARPEGMTNKNMSTGDVEVEVKHFSILSAAATPPFQVSDDNVSENLRLEYRYLDLRSQRLHRSLRIRHQATQIVRNFMNEEKFFEIETPILYKSTPEGARDYLVPSRVHPGNFYALPQSPQTLKQLLMIAGYDRYYQIARCFRDEDLRADRQPEFTQIDVEMAFVDMEDVIDTNEKLLRLLWKEIKGVEVGDIPRMTYDEAMERYGSDRPDTRFGLELVDMTEVLRGSGFKVFDDVIERKGALKAIGVPGIGGYSRGQFDKLTKVAKSGGAKGLVWIKKQDGKFGSTVSKFFDDAAFEKMFEACNVGEGDGVLIVADDFRVTCESLSALRLHLGHELKLIDTSKDKFLWVTDFPLFDYDPEGGRWVACHHPFTAPKDEYVEIMKSGDQKRYGEIKAKAYDIVCNGFELGGGSIRIHNQDIQQAMFQALGMDDAEIKEKFGFFVEALSYGTPPHGGIAWGMDRLAMVLCDTDAIREVIAFPKTTKASDMMAQAPSRVVQDQLLELGIRLAPSVEAAMKEARAPEADA